MRLTPAHIDAQITRAACCVFPGTTLTVCALTLRSGFHVVGELGHTIAFNNARQKIWALEGYVLSPFLVGASIGLHRFSLGQLALHLSGAILAADDRAPATYLGSEAAEVE